MLSSPTTWVRFIVVLHRYDEYRSKNNKTRRIEARPPDSFPGVAPLFLFACCLCRGDTLWRGDLLRVVFHEVVADPLDIAPDRIQRVFHFCGGNRAQALRVLFRGHIAQELYKISNAVEFGHNVVVIVHVLDLRLIRRCFRPHQCGYPSRGAYGNFEKVGPLPFELPRNDETITTEPGDIILYQGNQITIYYDENTWNFTRLAKIDNVTREELLDVLGSGDVTVTFWIEWSE